MAIIVGFPTNNNLLQGSEVADEIYGNSIGTVTFVAGSDRIFRHYGASAPSAEVALPARPFAQMGGREICECGPPCGRWGCWWRR